MRPSRYGLFSICLVWLIVVGTGCSRGHVRKQAGAPTGNRPAEAPYRDHDLGDIAILTRQYWSATQPKAKQPLAKSIARGLRYQALQALDAGHLDRAFTHFLSICHLLTADDLRGHTSVGPGTLAMISKHLIATAHRLSRAFARVGAVRETTTALFVLLDADKKNASNYHRELEEIRSYSTAAYNAVAGAAAGYGVWIRACEFAYLHFPSVSLSRQLVQRYTERRTSVMRTLRRGRVNAGELKKHEAAFKTGALVAQALSIQGAFQSAQRELEKIIGLGDAPRLRARLHQALRDENVLHWLQFATELRRSTNGPLASLAAIATLEYAFASNNGSKALHAALGLTWQSLDRPERAAYHCRLGLGGMRKKADCISLLIETDLRHIEHEIENDRPNHAQAMTNSLQQLAREHPTQYLERAVARAHLVLARGFAKLGLIKESNRALRRASRLGMKEQAALVRARMQFAANDYATSLSTVGALSAPRSRSIRERLPYSRRVRLLAELHRYADVNESRKKSLSEHMATSIRALESAARTKLDQPYLLETYGELSRLYWLRSPNGQATAIDTTGRLLDLETATAKTFRDMTLFFLLYDGYDEALHIAKRGFTDPRVAKEERVELALWLYSYASSRARPPAVEVIKLLQTASKADSWQSHLARLALGLTNIRALALSPTNKRRQAEALYVAAATNDEPRLRQQYLSELRKTDALLAPTFQLGAGLARYHGTKHNMTADATVAP